MKAQYYNFKANITCLQTFVGSINFAKAINKLAYILVVYKADYKILGGVIGIAAMDIYEWFA